MAYLLWFSAVQGCLRSRQALRQHCASLPALPHLRSHSLSCPVPHPPPLSHLYPSGLRTETSIAVETAQCFSTHHVAMLVGYGAHAVCPYLAFETCRQWRASPRTENLIKAGKVRGMAG